MGEGQYIAIMMVLWLINFNVCDNKYQRIVSGLAFLLFFILTIIRVLA